MVNYMRFYAETYIRNFLGEGLPLATIFSTKYAGVGTSLSSNFYLRNFYSANRDARTSSKRSAMSSTELSLADSQALRRAVKQLGASNFDEKLDEKNIRNRVLAFIDTYNNTLSSAADSSDKTIERSAKQLKSLTKQHASELDKIGITVNENGTLESRLEYFEKADISKFKSLFSKDSEYMQRTLSYTKRMQRSSEALELSERTQKLKKESEANNTPADSDTVTAAAQIVSASLDLDTLANTGIGKNINLSL